MELLGRLEHPQRTFPVVHVAGTNGKGSTVAMVSEALRAAGYRVGRFTSPHLSHPRERIWLDGAPLSEAEYVARLDGIAQAAAATEAAYPELPPFKEFDRWCALAWCAFRDAAVDIAVVEAGIGGGRDATDLLEDKRVTAISAVGRDHMRYLGETVEAIATEKARIFRAGVPALTSAGGEVAEILAQAAASVGAPFTALTPLPATSAEDGHWVVTLPDGPCRLALAGAYQVQNATLAYGVLEALNSGGFSVSPAAMRHGLEAVVWPGRFERLADPAGGAWLLDGAHNLQAAEALTASWGEVGVVVAAMQTTKEAAPIVERLTRGGVPLVLPSLSDGEYWDARVLAASAHGPVYPVDGLAPALALARTLAPDGVRAVTGSIYLVGAARAALQGG